jgi:hypothetical protein
LIASATSAAHLGLRHHTRNRLAVASDADGAAALYFVQQLRPFRLGLGGLKFQNIRHIFDRSNRPVNG